MLLATKYNKTKFQRNSRFKIQKEKKKKTVQIWFFWYTQESLGFNVSLLCNLRIFHGPKENRILLCFFSHSFESKHDSHNLLQYLEICLDDTVETPVYLCRFTLYTKTTTETPEQIHNSTILFHYWHRRIERQYTDK